MSSRHGSTVLLTLTLLAATPAFAQQSPPESPPSGEPSAPAPQYPPPPPRPVDQQPQPPQQPPSYGYPPSYGVPPRYNSYYGPQNYYQPAGVYRPISFSIGAGPGALIGPGEHQLALSYNLFRIGFGVAPNLAFFVSFEGAGTSSINPATDEDSWLKQETWQLGLQFYLLPQVYIRGGIGAGFVNESTDFASFSGGTGIAFSGALGYEFVQSRHVALALEAAGNATKYSRESWAMTGLNLSLTFF
jgi:hypothetical protein